MENENTNPRKLKKDMIKKALSKKIETKDYKYSI